MLKFSLPAQVNKLLRSQKKESEKMGEIDYSDLFVDWDLPDIKIDTVENSKSYKSQKSPEQRIMFYEKFIQQHFEKGLRLIQYSLERHQELCRELLTTAKSLRQEENFLLAKIKKLQEEIEEVKSGIILSKDNAHRTGRPPLTDDEIAQIRELISKGYTQRETAKIVGVSNGSVSKYKPDNTVKVSDNNRNEQKSGKSELSGPSRLFTKDE